VDRKTHGSWVFQAHVSSERAAKAYIENVIGRMYPSQNGQVIQQDIMFQVRGNIASGGAPMADQSDYDFDVTGITEANAQEMQSIKEAAVANGTFMKAPNGNFSNLNERQWLQVRTKAFKEWFGEWELRFKSVNVIPVSMRFKNFQAAKEWAENNIAGIYEKEQTGGKGRIEISKGAISKFFNNSAVVKSENAEIHKSVISVLPEVIKNSVVGETHPDYKKIDGVRKPKNGIIPNTKIHRLFGAVELDGKIYRVKTTVKYFTDKSNENKVHSYEVIKIELLDETDNSTERNPDSQTVSPIAAAKLLQNVEKSYEKGKFILDDHSKVVDENGEPLVVYHGTNNKFTEFDTHRNNYLTGTWFTPNKKRAITYGRNLMGVFLNVKNPSNDFFIRENYDGIMQTDDIYGKSIYEVIVFSPSQIKSATDNNGNFDSESDDIRFMFAGEQGIRTAAQSADEAVRREAETRLDNLDVARQMEAKFEEENTPEISEMKARVAEWLKQGNLEWARGKTKDEIIKHFDNELKPVGYIPVKYVSLIDADVTDNRVYSGQGYFIDHAVNHHPDVEAEKYDNIQGVLNNPDDIKETFKEGKRAVVFIKNIDRWNAVAVHVEKNEEGKIILYTTFFNQKKKPYANEKSIRPVSSEGGVSSIVRTEKSAHGRSLSARNDGAKVNNFLIPDNISREDAKKIKFATGWERGSDGKWRYEIQDVKVDVSKLNYKAQGYKDPYDFYGKKQKLSDVIDAPDFFELYPQAKEISVELLHSNTMGYGTFASYDDKNKVISVSSTIFNVEDSELQDEANRIFAHEIQHFIQDTEGFAKGTRVKRGNYKKYEQTAGEVEARNVERRMNMSAEARRASLAVETEDVDRGEQIFLFGALSNPSQIKSATSNNGNFDEKNSDIRFMVGDFDNSEKSGNFAANSNNNFNYANDRDKARLGNERTMDSRTIHSVVGERAQGWGISKTLSANYNRAGNRTGTPTEQAQKFSDNIAKSARENGVWIDNAISELTTGAQIGEGGESSVYLSKDGKNAIKLTHLSYFTDSQDIVYKYAAHNQLFPKTEYKIIGFAKDEQGRNCVVLEQPFVFAPEKAIQKQVDDYLIGNGWKKIDEGVFESGEFRISDALIKEDNDNILLDGNGNLRFIDPFIIPTKKLDGAAESPSPSLRFQTHAPSSPLDSSDKVLYSYTYDANGNLTGKKALT
ncbi:MAG: hypothetical protein LBS50_00215, partial [Prevotellaceae bacterium]|nr:hypothetical protein [Prevotellaceae bacterium]